jgi:hypothetical protein
MSLFAMTAALQIKEEALGRAWSDPQCIPVLVSSFWRTFSSYRPSRRARGQVSWREYDEPF